MKELEDKFIEIVNEACSLTGMDKSDSALFAKLYVQPGEIFMEDLAKETGYSLASISNKIKMLEQTDLISKKTGPGTRKISIYMKKDLLKFFKDIFAKKNYKLKIIKEKIPDLIKEFKSKAKTTENKKKLKIFEDYYKQLLKFDKLFNFITDKIDEMNKE